MPLDRSRFRPSRTFLLALTSGVLLWAAFPPLAIWPLAWLAPVCWLRLIRLDRMPASRPYRDIYAAGLVHWLLLTQWVRLPHWSAGFGWVTLCLYLAVYLPVFIGCTRVAVHRWRVPLIVAAPVVWTGLELARGYLLTGFSLALLGHTQVDWLQVIQIADLFGAYAVSFLVMLVAACLEAALPSEGKGKRFAWWPLPLAAAVVAVALLYGTQRVRSGIDQAVDDPPVRIALIQGSVDTEFGGDPDRFWQTFVDYRQLSTQAIQEHDGIDLLVWPESMFTAHWPLVTYDEQMEMPPDFRDDPDEFRMRVTEAAAAADEKTRWTTEQLQTPLLAGTESVHYGAGEPQRYNSAVYINTSGQVIGRYDKMHPVMFGEYVPLGNWFPWLYRLTPMSSGLTAGRAPVVFEVEGLRLSPSICFENTVPHLIRRQYVQLQHQGLAPDVLVTVTNDGWFWGSSLLDLHLTCGVFRAIENRCPMLIAANTGFSAWIDGSGRVVSKGPRRDTGVVVADVRTDARRSPYHRWGDWPMAVCLAFCLIAGGAGLRQKIKTR